MNKAVGSANIRPVVAIIADKVKSYTISGYDAMDKRITHDVIQYVYGENTIFVERCFSNSRIEDLVKQYILEQEKIDVFDNEKECYNDLCDVAVVDSTKEGTN